jgi:hypothetical protein
VTNPISGSVTGNAGSATKLATARNINGVAFDGTSDIMISADGGTLTGTVEIDHGGTGETTQQSAINALAGGVASGQYLRGNGTNVVMSGIQATDVPILNQNTTGNASTATALQTSRLIFGNNFNGTADLNQIISSTYGGTGNGYTKFTGPTTSEKTFTLPDANAILARTDAGQTFVGSQTFSASPVISSLTTGSIPFIGASKQLAEDNANLYWDETNKRLGIGTNTLSNNRLTIGGASDSYEAIGRNISNGALGIYGGVSEATGAYFKITGTGEADSPGPGSAEFVIRNLADSKYSLWSYDGASAWTSIFRIDGQTGNTWLVPSAGHVGIGITAGTAPTALLHLNAGTASAGTSPLKFTLGTNLTSAEAGAVEYDGKVFYSTPATNSRGVSPSEAFIALNANQNAANNGNAQDVFNQDITLQTSTTYMFEGQYSIYCTGTNATTISSLFGGTATITSIGYNCTAAKGTSTSAVQARLSYIETVAATVVTNSTPSNYVTVAIRGIVRVNAGGTFIPQFQYSSAPGVIGVTPVIQANSYFKIYPIGTNTISNVGNWN